MGQALYRKYRSKSLKEIVGQEHITQTLEQALKQGRISHAYLFTGPRGVGKTSVARILAHRINDLPYSDDSAHIDIIEIDAASNRRIDEIRDLRDKVYVAPTSAKYKVYIIDEVHMLTREAFNALLKTLEEPPAHVVFILATTDAHKLPETIISRTQRFGFKPADKISTATLLADIAQKEGFKVGPEALDLLVEHGAGSFRDSVGLLDQVSSQKAEISIADVQQLLGIPPEEAIGKLVGSLGTEPAKVISSLSDLFNQGYQAAIIAKLLGQRLRQALIEGSPGLSAETVLKLLDGLIEVPVSPDPERKLEIVLLGGVTFTAPQSSPKPVEKASVPDSAPVIEAPEPISVTAEPEVKVDEPPEIVAEPPKPKASAKPSAGAQALLNSESWGEVLKALKSRHNTLYGILRMAQPGFDDPDKLTLTFGFSFHQKRMAESSNRQKLATFITEVTGRDVNVECLVDESAKSLKAKSDQPNAKPTEVKTEDKGDLAAISNIFGGGELLES
jgi:DNA polymerase-3 subunit gamma/tau